MISKQGAHLVLLAGDPGIGKTRLAEELLEDHTVLRKLMFHQLDGMLLSSWKSTFEKISRRTLISSNHSPK